MDKYDKHIESLLNSEDPIEEIHYDWSIGKDLFQFCSIKGKSVGGTNCGCLTMIAYVNSVIEHEVKIDPSIDDMLTQQIRSDDRIPRSFADITTDDLPVFAEWQRKLDVYREQFKQ